MIKVAYKYKGEYCEDKCETCLEAAVLVESLKSNSHVTDIKEIYD